MATRPANADVQLVTPRPEDAERVAAWIADANEGYWVAPQTRLPITPSDVRGWEKRGHEPHVLVHDDDPVGYGELNVLNGPAGRYWLGHILVNPTLRGQGFGRLLVERLLRRAFVERDASRVNLVVFTENAPAIATYHVCGFRQDGFETHTFPVYRRTERLLRMMIRRNDYLLERSAPT